MVRRRSFPWFERRASRAGPIEAADAETSLGARATYEVVLDKLADGKWRAEPQLPGYEPGQIAIHGDLDTLLTQEIRRQVAFCLPGVGAYAFDLRCVDESGALLATHTLAEQPTGRHRQADDGAYEQITVTNLLRQWAGDLPLPDDEDLSHHDEGEQEGTHGDSEIVHA